MGGRIKKGSSNAKYDSNARCMLGELGGEQVTICSPSGLPPCSGLPRAEVDDQRHVEAKKG